MTMANFACETDVRRFARRAAVLAGVCALILLCGLAMAFAGEPDKKPVDNLTVGEVLLINQALANMNCQGGTIIKKAGGDDVTCKVFDYVSSQDKRWIMFSRAIADNIAATKQTVETYGKLRNAYIAALPAEARDKDGNLTQSAQAKLAVWGDEYIAGSAGQALAPIEHFKRSDLEAVGFQPGIKAALKPITDNDN